MATLSGSPIKARIMRLVKLDVCGVPVIGSGSVLTTKGFIRVQAKHQYEDGTEYLQKNADGEPCVNEKDPSFLKRVELSMDFCKIDPDGVVIVTGEPIITTGSPATGTGFALDEALLTTRFSLELWQPMAGDASCAGGVPQYAYWAWPNVGNPKVGDLSFEQATLTLALSGETKLGAAEWGDGPGSGTAWLPSGYDSRKHEIFNITTVAPPAAPAASGATALS